MAARVTTRRSEEGKTDYAWARILDDFPEIAETVRSGGLYHLSAEVIKRYREPRLMTKFDTSEQVAQPLKDIRANVLADSRGSYVLGDFDVFERLPRFASTVRPHRIRLPEFETLRVSNLTSESNAINALKLSGALSHFLGDDELCETFNGRTGSGEFAFDIEMRSGELQSICVRRAQLEVDGGFESPDAVVIMEAKNVRHTDFNVRQLYYPYRKFAAITSKPVRLVFSQYTNLTYRLVEYEFGDPGCMSSIRLVGAGLYTFERVTPTPGEMIRACEETQVLTDDNQEYATVPFIQADRFDRIVSLAERLVDVSWLTSVEVAEFIGMAPRQGLYYGDAGVYVGLLERGDGRYWLSDRGRRVLEADYHERILGLASLMCEHEVFHRLLPEAVRTGEVPRNSVVADLLRELNVCNDTRTLPGRRASTVRGWIRWIVEAMND